MSSLAYDVPAPLFDAFADRGARLLVRAVSGATMVRHLHDKLLDSVVSVRVPSTGCDPDVFPAWRSPIPLDVVLVDPAAEFPMQYRLSELLARRPVRVSIPVQPGFSKAIRLAAALHLPIKLELSQPEAPLVRELLEVLDHYLHRPLIRQPIEYLHSVLMAFFHRVPATPWRIQEEDPADIRYVNDDGQESLPPRLAGLALSAPQTASWRPSAERRVPQILSVGAASS